jgi:Protein of unknown function (DUF4239)
MNLYFVYDYPTWMLFIGMIGLICLISLGSVLIFRGWTDNKLKVSDGDNAIISDFLGINGVFFGLVLGMVAVGAWDSFQEASGTAAHEASQLATLYRSVAMLPEKEAAPLKAAVRSYADIVIDQEWQSQQQGRIPKQGDRAITAIGRLLYALPVDQPQKELAASVAMERYYSLIEARRDRIEQAANSALPASLWWVMVASTFIIMSLSLLMRIENRRLDIVVNLLMSVLTGSILAFIVAMDNPFRGELSVTPASYEIIRDNLMNSANSGL